MLNGLPSQVKRALLIIRYIIKDISILYFPLYMWREFGMILKIDAIITGFNIRVTHKNKTIFKKDKVKSVKDIKKICEKLMKEHTYKKEDI